MTFRDYAQYTLTEFLEDDSFIQWVLQADAKSNSFWQSFLTAHPEKATVVKEAVSIIRVYRRQSTFSNETRRGDLWRRIDTSIAQQNTPIRTFRLHRYVKIAAAVALLVSSGFVLWMFGNTHTKTITTSYGEVKAVTLPDQSIVMLNGNSVLTYEDTWAAHAPREVWIKGEGYFDVKHINADTLSILPEERFIVHGNGIDVQVLGTSFNMKSRRNKTNIALLSGKIEVSYADPSSVASGGLVMLPGDYVEYAGQKLLTKRNSHDHTRLLRGLCGRLRSPTHHSMISWKHYKIIMAMR